MSNLVPIIQIDDIQREMTQNEIENLEITRSFHAQELKIQEDLIAAKAAEKAALLARLGITADEAALLLS